MLDNYRMSSLRIKERIEALWAQVVPLRGVLCGSRPQHPPAPGTGFINARGDRLLRGNAGQWRLVHAGRCSAPRSRSDANEIMNWIDTLEQDLATRARLGRAA
jgi:hypothetical protein